MSSRVYYPPQKWVLLTPVRVLVLLARLNPSIKKEVSNAWIELLSRVDDPYVKLDMFMYHYRNLPAQQSQQWLDERAYIIGGSEISAVLGNSAYGTLKSVALSKLGIKKFHGNVCTKWGVSFEPVVTAIIEKELNTKVRSSGSISGMHQNGVYIQTYSPDGLCVVENNIVLLEIKSPYSRIPDNNIPKEYIDQILLGLGTISIADYGLFVDACFRTCSYTEWDYNDSCTTRKKDKIVQTVPLYLGFIITAEPGDVGEIRDAIRRLMQVPQDKLVEEAMALDVYKHFAVHIASQKNGEPIVCDTNSLMLPPSEKGDIYFTQGSDHRDMHISVIKEYFRKGMIVKSITFWKLFHLSKVRVARDEGYMNKIYPTVCAAVEHIESLRKKMEEDCSINE